MKTIKVLLLVLQPLIWFMTHLLLQPVAAKAGMLNSLSAICILSALVCVLVLIIDLVERFTDEPGGI